jgi:hypothetical protein
MTEIDPEARRAQLRAVRATMSTPGTGSAALPRRRPHPARASRVLATGLAAGSAIGLIGVLAHADRTATAAATSTVATTAPDVGTAAGPATGTATTVPPATARRETAPPITAPPATSPPVSSTGAS